MLQVLVEKSKLGGVVEIPSSKSHSLRAILLASLANGQSRLEGILNSPDAQAMIKACRLFGADIQESKEALTIYGVNGAPKTPDDIIDAGNSGIVLRFCGAIAALCNQGKIVLTGDQSLRNRPVQALMDGLNGLGANAESISQAGKPPLLVSGNLRPGTVRINGSDSQPVSALLFATSFLKGESEILVDCPGELPWIDLTLWWAKKMGMVIHNENYRRYIVKGFASYPGFYMKMPADFSSAAFPLAAACLTQSRLELRGLDFDDPQGDKALIDVLKQMGAEISYEGDRLEIVGRPLKGTDVDCDAIIDAIPILAVLASQAHGKTRLYNAESARYKECDRLRCMARELKKMGAQVEEFPDGLEITGSDLTGTIVESHGDHRVAMSLMVAGLAAKGVTTVTGVECISKTYPNFIESLNEVGAAFR